MKQKKVFLLSGVPGSGKTTWVQNRMNDKSRHISRDAIRFSMLDNNDEYFAHEKAVFNRFISHINEAITDPHIETIYVDATHINAKSRNKTLSRLNLTNCEVNLVIFDIPIGVCLKRNAQRIDRARVPDEVIFRMKNSFTLPNESEHFDNCYYVNEVGEFI